MCQVVFLHVSLTHLEMCQWLVVPRWCRGGSGKFETIGFSKVSQTPFATIFLSGADRAKRTVEQQLFLRIAKLHAGGIVPNGVSLSLSTPALRNGRRKKSETR